MPLSMYGQWCPRCTSLSWPRLMRYLAVISKLHGFLSWPRLEACWCMHSQFMCFTSCLKWDSWEFQLLRPVCLWPGSLWMLEWSATRKVLKAHLISHFGKRKASTLKTPFSSNKFGCVSTLSAWEFGATGFLISLLWWQAICPLR